jgi:hypothetical protein
MELYIYDGATGEHIQREYTPEEKAIRDTEIAQAQAELVAKQAEAETKEAQRQALLDRLGLTSEEAKILLGA